VILLPPFVGAVSVGSLFKVCQAISRVDDPVVLDAREVLFVDPLGLATLGALLEPMCGHREVQMLWLRTTVASYLDRMSFFQRCVVQGVEVPSRTHHDQRAKLVELTRIANPSDIDDASFKLAMAISGENLALGEPFGERAAQRHPLQYALSELLQNALTHARREGRRDAAVWVAAQFYPFRDLVRLAVVDNGCGMLATLRNHPQMRDQTHLSALFTALLPRVSCNRDVGPFAQSVNSGVGLTTTFHIAQAAKGGLTLASGDAVHSTQGKARTMDGYWNGVAVEMVFRRGSLKDVRVADQLPALDAPSVPLRFED
jgi:hypothetical protein